MLLWYIKVFSIYDDLVLLTGPNEHQYLNIKQTAQSMRHFKTLFLYFLSLLPVKERPSLTKHDMWRLVHLKLEGFTVKKVNAIQFIHLNERDYLCNPALPNSSNEATGPLTMDPLFSVNLADWSITIAFLWQQRRQTFIAGQLTVQASIYHGLTSFIATDCLTVACFTAIKQQSLFPVPSCTLQPYVLFSLALQNVHWYFCFIMSSAFYTVRTVSKLVAVESTAMCPWNLNSNIDIFKITCNSHVVLSYHFIDTYIIKHFNSKVFYAFSFKALL